MKRNLAMVLLLAVFLTGCGKHDPATLKIRRGTKVIEAEAYKDNKEIRTVIIPNTVTTIGYKAFMDCDNLESVVIPDSVTVIDEMAFYSCDNLKSIELPDSLKTFGNNAFGYCKNLTTVTIPGSVEVEAEEEREWGQYYGVFDGCKGLTSVVLSEGLKRIGPGWFKFCEQLTSVEIPDSVISIEEEAFDFCKGLTSIDLPDSLEFIGRDAFIKCTGLTSIELPDSLKKIKSGAFEDCTNLVDVRIPDGIESIGSAFKGCKSLEKIVLPEGVAVLSDVAFEGTGLMEGIENLIHDDWSTVRAALEDAEDLTGAEGPLEGLSGKRVMPILNQENVAVDGAMFCVLPASVRTIDWREADAILLVIYSSEARDDYIGFAYNKITRAYLYSAEDRAKLLFKKTDAPPLMGQGTLSGEEATPGEIWEGIRRFFEA